MKRKAFIFVDTMPDRQGSGARLRFFSNIQAFLDLGYEVEVINISSRADKIPDSSELQGVTWTQIEIEEIKNPNFITRLSFRIGLINSHSIKYLFPLSETVRHEAVKRFQVSPEALFLFDGESQACVIPWMPKKMLSIWGIHDLPSQNIKATINISCDTESRSMTQGETRVVSFMCRFERMMANKSKLVLCIGTDDEEIITKEFKCSHAEYLPMSIPINEISRNKDCPSGKKKLHILHLGAIQHLPSYRSLEYLFSEIYPAFPEELSDVINLSIVGKIVDGERSNYIKELARPYKNVIFTDFVDDIFPFYECSDLQIVASTDSVGIRTRIIESFAYGLPVMSTLIGAKGIKGLKNNENIIIANTPLEFVNALQALIKYPEKLTIISQNAKELYWKEHSRPVVASTLSRLLNTHL